MKRLVIEIPEGMLCAFLNYVHVDDDGEEMMGVLKIDTDDIIAGHVTVEPMEEV